MNDVGPNTDASSPRAAVLRPLARIRPWCRAMCVAAGTLVALPPALSACPPGPSPTFAREAPVVGPKADGTGADPARCPQASRRKHAHAGRINSAQTGDVVLTLLGTTDTHGHLLPIDYYTGRGTRYGLTLLASMVDSVRAVDPGNVYLFDSGDILEGNPLGFVYARLDSLEPSPIIGAMNRLRYAVSAVGNHEYDYGLRYLRRAMKQAHFPFVAANIFVHGTDRHAYRPYVLIPHPTPEGDTILIGVTGNTPPDVAMWDRRNVNGVLDFRDVVASVRPVVREMRARGADLVVVLSHGGLGSTSHDAASAHRPPDNEAARLAREVPGIDIIFLGHTHRQLADSTINGVLLTQAKNFGASLADVTVTMRRAARDDWRVVAKHSRLLRPVPGRQDTTLADYLAPANRRTLAWVHSPIGVSSVTMSARASRVEDTPIMDFINEVERRVSGAQLASTAAFNLRATLPAGTVTIADIAGLYTYDNTLKVVRITGAQLRAYLEKSADYYNGWPPPPGGTVTNFRVPGYDFDVISGVDYTLDLRRPVGHRVTELRWHGQPVRPDQTFTLALNNYRQSGGGGFAMLASAPVIYDRQQDIRDLLIQEVQRRGVIRPGDYFHDNWRIVPRVAADSALEEQTRGRSPNRRPSRTGRRP